MPTPFTSSTFLDTYRDDYRDSDGYHRVLFNGGRALQARELTQLQTIIQNEIARFGRNIFKEGAAVNPGGLTVNNRYEFIKLAVATVLPTNASVLLDTEFTGQTSGVKFRVLEVVPAEGADPATLYVTYTDTSAAVAGANPIRISAGEVVNNGTYAFTVQTTNTIGNPAFGRGTRASIASGDFFTQNHFVFAPAQSLLISKYTSDPTAEVGFLVVQDIVTPSDNIALYDNQNITPNLAAPGADRYRIRLIATTRDMVDSDQTFVYLANVVDGILVDEVKGNDDYNIINDLLALRTREESGNYNVKPFKIKFEEDDSDDTILNLKISDGISYVYGYRAAKEFPTKIEVPKARDTITFNNEVVAANYGNYVLGTGGKGARNINVFERVNLRSATNYGGSTIGTARVRAVEEDGINYRFYLFEIVMNAGQSFRNVVSMGNSVTDFTNLILENAKAVLKDTANNSLLFPLPRQRPSSLSDISLTVQRRFLTTTNGSGTATINLTAPGETFANTNQWFFAEDDSAPVSASVTGAGTASVTISSSSISSSNFEVLAYVNKGAGSSRTKTLTETFGAAPIESDGNGLLFINLEVADIYDVISIKGVDSDGPDISNRFTLDNGQRDNFYDLGRLILRGGQTAPTGNVFARFRYFAHGTSGDFFSVNSYTGQVDYADIPSHRLNNGQVVSLRDVLDFRPVKNVSGTFSGGNARVNELPQNTDLITADVVYYQPRFSKLIIDTSGNLKVISGPSSLDPVLPPTPANALELYNIRLNPFTLNDSDMTVTKIENRRYTMADIGKLEKRIDNLEELTALSLLELDTANFDVLDSSGANRTKSGFLVDNFKDHFFSDTQNPEYRASIDISAGRMRPTFVAENSNLTFVDSASTGVVKKGDNIYLQYNHTPLINQPLASGTENVNPFAVITNQGTLRLSPSSDVWADQVRIPARVIDGGTNQIDNNLARNWNNWQWNWSGRDLNFSRNLNETQVGSATRSTNRNVGSGSIVTTQTIREVVGERVVDVAFVPFMRSIKVYFRGEGLRPNTRMFPFFDGVLVSNWCRAETFVNISDDPTEYGNTFNNATQHPQSPSTLITNSEGKIEGSFFIPNTSGIRFRSGTREFKLLDISSNDNALALSRASSNFTSSGVIETIQSTIVSTRRITTQRGGFQLSQGPDEGERNTQKDPLAQSFFVNSLTGVFLTKVDLFFSTKDPIIPVQVQLRPMVNGAPSSTAIIPGSEKFLPPSAVNVSSNGTAATTFEFDEPIFLAPQTEYAIVVLAESTKYNLFVAETYAFIIGSTEKKVSLQPTMGSLFKSQNGSTWEPDQTKDMKFVLYKANFTSTTGTVILENAALPKQLLNSDPFSVDSGSSSVTVFHPNHGFIVGDTVNIDIDSAVDVGGISGTSLLGNRTITALDQTGYTFTADSAATSDAIGGGTVLATQNIMFDVVQPNIQTLVPNDTSVAFSGKFTTGKSLAGNETPYQKLSTFQDIFVGENNLFTSPRMIANATLEAAELGAGVRSATIKVDFSTLSTEVSPVIDLQRASLTLINNIIDNQDSAATSGFNVPLNFVDETDPSEGSMVAKHITKQVTLEEDAVGLKILLAANRPSVGGIKVYYRTNSGEASITEVPWVQAALERAIPSDENPEIFREYEYLVGGLGGALQPFTSFQVKIVFTSTNSSKVPVVRDLRVIALGV